MLSPSKEKMPALEVMGRDARKITDSVGNQAGAIEASRKAALAIANNAPGALLAGIANAASSAGAQIKTGFTGEKHVGDKYVGQPVFGGMTANAAPPQALPTQNKNTNGGGKVSAAPQPARPQAPAAPKIAAPAIQNGQAPARNQAPARERARQTITGMANRGGAPQQTVAAPAPPQVVAASPQVVAASPIAYATLGGGGPEETSGVFDGSARHSVQMKDGTVVTGDDARRLFDGMGGGADSGPVQVIRGLNSETYRPFEGQYVTQGQQDEITANRLNLGAPMTVGQAGAIGKQAASLADRSLAETAATERTGMSVEGGIAQQRISTGGAIQTANIAHGESNKLKALEAKAISALDAALKSGDPVAISTANQRLSAVRGGGSGEEFAPINIYDDMGQVVGQKLYGKKSGVVQSGQGGAQKFENGKTYTDANGNRAKYVDGKWQGVK